MENKYKYFKRDISWLSFNYRVLLEALDERLPLYERINFISIYSSNLEEFYKIRVADHKAVASGATESDEESVQSARELVEEINKEVISHVKKLTLKLARTLGFVITSIISPKLKLAVNTINDANGIITIILNIVRVTPIEIPKPGITLLFLLLILHHLFFLINFIKHSTIGKMLFLYGIPTTEILYCN